MDNQPLRRASSKRADGAAKQFMNIDLVQVTRALDYAAKKHVSQRRKGEAKRGVGMGQRRGEGLERRDLMSEFVQCLDPDGLHGLSTRTHVLCLFY